MKSSGISTQFLKKDIEIDGRERRRIEERKNWRSRKL
jgi:hypothetical protein